MAVIFDLVRDHPFAMALGAFGIGFGFAFWLFFLLLRWTFLPSYRRHK